MPAVRASPVDHRSSRARTAPMKRSWMASVTIAIDDAVQRWPVEPNPPCTRQSTAMSRSASSTMTRGFLPPSSSCTLRPSGAGASRMVRPVVTDPVNVTPLTRGSVVRVGPSSEPRPSTRLSAPAGSPERLRMSTSSHALPGTSSAGLKTTVFPKASAGAIFHAGMAIGKFHGVMTLTTPMGSRVTETSTPGRTESSTWPCGARTAPAKYLRI